MAIETPDFKDSDRARRLMKYAEVLKQYVRSKPADTERLSGMLQEIKGSRNLRDTAADLDTNASTLSRAINESTAHISDDLIVAMANAADKRPELGFDFDDIVQANGMELRSVARPNQARVYEKNASNTIIAGLVTHGYTVLGMDDEPLEKNVYSSWKLDMAVHCRKDEQPYYIGGEMKKMSYAENSQRQNEKGVAVAWQSLTRIFAVLYERPTKFSNLFLAIDSAKAYAGLKDRCDGMAVRDNISLILLSPEGTEIKNEYAIPKEDHTEHIIFN